METRDIIFSAVMVVSAFVLTLRWLSIYHQSDPVLIIAAMILIGCLASLILSLDIRIKRMESRLESRDRSMRINIQNIEENVDRKLNTIVHMVNDTIEDLSKKVYR